ncbi:MAG: HDIG domain-containing protein [Chloroflexi bacterium]|nr:HDIG domain-containing protein [Chloroflexota bacterium]MBI5291128.1 HDIG domain-containing protein [Chloroflexota bacterium]
MPGARYRVTQFARLFTGRLTLQARAEAQTWLAPPLFELFCRMTPAEQYHAYEVRQTLAAQRQVDPDLLTAALLHDVGKTRMPLAAWERALIVLGNHLAPQAADAWGRMGGSPLWWRRPFVVSRQHPAWGAEMVRVAGGAPRTVELILHHQNNHPLDPMLQALQSADNSN